MKAKKKLSIIIPVYNEEKFIKTTLEKVINSNTLGLEKEIIIVDDGSTDKTVDKIKQFIKTHKNHRIVLITSKKTKEKELL